MAVSERKTSKTQKGPSQIFLDRFGLEAKTCRLISFTCWSACAWGFQVNQCFTVGIINCEAWQYVASQHCFGISMSSTHCLTSFLHFQLSSCGRLTPAPVLRRYNTRVRWQKGHSLIGNFCLELSQVSVMSDEEYDQETMTVLSRLNKYDYEDTNAWSAELNYLKCNHFPKYTTL